MRTVVACVMWIGLAAAGCGDDDGTGPDGNAASSRAYKGHETDADMNAFIATYPGAAGTRLDDCQTCHTSGTIAVDGKDTYKNACDFCHLIPFPVDGATGAPAGFVQTLNPYGQAYLEAGRDRAAVRDIRNQDSDGDGSSNADEIGDSRYPGSANSKPGQQRATLEVMDVADLEGLPVHTQLLLANASKQQFDDYAQYTGVRVVDLLTHLGVPLDGEFAGITIVSADGFMKDFGKEAVLNRYPNSRFYSGLDTGTKGTDCGFVTYPPASVTGALTDGAEIPDEQWLMLGYRRDGSAMDPSYLDPVSGSIEGEGPLRIIVPQGTPGMPDRGSKYSPSNCADGLDYDKNKDHNAGSMVRGVVAIRVNPMPAGVEEFDAMNGGWAYVDALQLIVYGYGIQ